MPLASIALTRGHYRILEGERFSIVRMEAYLRALAALPRGRGAGFAVTPKGARSGGSPVARALRLPIALAALSAAAIGYQTTAQVLDLPGRLPPMRIDDHHPLGNGEHRPGRLGGRCGPAGVQHRRRSHRFPAQIHAAYSADSGVVPSLVGRTTDLSRATGRASQSATRASRASGSASCCCSTTDPIEVGGVIATVAAAGDGEGWVVGVDFEDLDRDVSPTPS